MKYIVKIISSAVIISVLLSCFALPAFAFKVDCNTSQEYTSSEYGKKLMLVELTGDQRQDAVTVAYTQIGYHEGSLSGSVKSTSDLTEYNRWYYEDSSTKVPWCATFISWVFCQAGISEETFPKFSGCSSAVSELSKKDGWHDGYLNGGDYIPKKGDIVFFAWQKDIEFKPQTYFATVNGKREGQVNHVGIVIDDAENTYSHISTIEGNVKGCCDKGCCVKQCSRSPLDVVGYFTPAYKNTSSSLGEVEITVPENTSNAWIILDNPGYISWKQVDRAEYYEYTVRSQMRNEDGSYRELDEWICCNITTADCRIPLENNPNFSRKLRQAEAFKVWIGARDSNGKLIAESFVYLRMSDSKNGEDITDNYYDPIPDFSYDAPIVSKDDEDPVPGEGYENPYGEHNDGDISEEQTSTEIAQTQENSTESLSILKRILYLLELLLSFFGISF